MVSRSQRARRKKRNKLNYLTKSNLVVYSPEFRPLDLRKMIIIRLKGRGFVLAIILMIGDILKYKLTILRKAIAQKMELKCLSKDTKL